MPIASSNLEVGYELCGMCTEHERVYCCVFHFGGPRGGAGGFFFFIFCPQQLEAHTGLSIQTQGRDVYAVWWTYEDERGSGRICPRFSGHSEWKGVSIGKVELLDEKS